MTNEVVLETQIRPMVIKLHPVMEMTDEQFFELCQVNPDFRFERTAEGELVIMPPTGAESGKRNASLIVQLGVWAERNGTGLIFDSSTGFTLPNGAVRSPDVAWVRNDLWEVIPNAQRKRFAPICPDFVVELRSENDRLSTLQEKMQEYIDNGAALGWLIDPTEQRVYVYRPNESIEVLEQPVLLRGTPVLPGFVLDLQKIW
jgi:Uma2 family endonuclease